MNTTEGGELKCYNCAKWRPRAAFLAARRDKICATCDVCRAYAIRYKATRAAAARSGST